MTTEGRKTAEWEEDPDPKKTVFNSVGKGKVIHILFERDHEEKTGSTLYEIACNKKELIVDAPFEKKLDISYVNCKNCMRNAYYHEQKVILKKKQEGSKENAKVLAKDRKDKVEGKHEKAKEKNLREDEVLIFCAMNENGEPLTSVMAPDIDLAKQKIIDELEKDKRKMRGWKKGGKIVTSKRISKHQMDDFYYGLIKEFREINVAMLNGIMMIVKQLNAFIEIAGTEFKSRDELRKVLAILKNPRKTPVKAGVQKKSGRKIISRKRREKKEK